jgi:hypothetical protein
MNEMRETQMKKIIALAVAGAFVAPAFAADVTVTGETEMQYVTTSGSTDEASNADNVVVVTASDEIDGVSISTSIVLDQDAVYDASTSGDGSSLTISANGISLAMGDVASAMDAVGDYTDISPAHGGFDGDGTDHSFLLTLPAMGGVQAYLSMSPTTGFDGSTADSTGYGAKVGVGAGEVYFGGEEDADSKWQSYGVKYTMGNVYVAYERGSDDAGSAADIKYTGFAAKYTMGDLVAGFEMQETKTDGASTATVDETITFLEYNLGSSVDLYIAREDNADSTGTADQTTVGVEYTF